jgi:alpha-galactosidase
MRLPLRPLVAGLHAGVLVAPAPALATAPDQRAEALALTPPMGFNNWNAFGCDVSATLIEQTADVLVSSGLAAAGYRYVNIDDCWSLQIGRAHV